MANLELTKELLGIISSTQRHFALKIEYAFNIPNRGTELSGWLLGDVRVGSSVGCLMDGKTRAELTDDFAVMGLERYKKLEEKLRGWPEPIGCGILVQTLPDPEKLVGLVFTGGYRVPQTPEMLELSDELESFQHHLSEAGFIMLIEQAFDLGEEGTALVGPLQGLVDAGESVGMIYDRERECELGEVCQVRSLVYNGKEEPRISSAFRLLPCGVVISGRHDPEALKGKLFVDWSQYQ